MGLKINWSDSVLFSFIAFILGWLSSVFMLGNSLTHIFILFYLLFGKATDAKLLY
jgi:hypothetical protein